MKRTFSATLTLLTLFTFSIPTHASFPDVPEEHPNYTAINYVQAGDIVSGHPDGTYKPDDKIDRAAFTKIIIESQFSDEEINSCSSANFKDIPDGTWYDKYVCIAQKNKVIDGYPDGTFGGEKLINLAEASKIISNAFGYQTQPDPVVWYKSYVEQLSQRKALPITLTGFSHQLTRGEMAEIVYRILVGVDFKKSLTYLELSTGNLSNEEEQAEFYIIEQALNYYLSSLALQRISDDEYNEFVFSFGENMANNFFDSTRKSLQDHIDALESLRQKIAEIQPYEGDKTLAEGLLENTDAKIEILTKDFSDVIDLYEQLSQLNENSSKAEINELIDSINTFGNNIAQKVKTSDDAMLQAYLNFAHKYNIPVKDLNAMNYANDLLVLFNQALPIYFNYNELALNVGIEGDLDLLEEQRKASLNQLEAFHNKVVEIGAYGEDSSLFDALLNAIDVRYNILSEREPKILKIWENYQSSGTLSQEDSDLWKSLDESTASEVISSGDLFMKTFEEFAVSYGFKNW